jgi:hypothetical protein
MPVPPRTNITHYRGDSMVLQVTLWNDALHTVPSDLSAALVRAQVRAAYDDPAIAAAFDVEVDGNVILANLSPKSARDLPPKGFWDLEVDWYADDTSVQTVAAGSWVTQADVTRDGV